MSESVKVAVRVRPFNQREKDHGSKLIIQMDGNQVLESILYFINLILYNFLC